MQANTNSNSLIRLGYCLDIISSDKQIQADRPAIPRTGSRCRWSSESIIIPIMPPSGDAFCCLLCAYMIEYTGVCVMKCWKCGGHMSRSGGWATCDSCGRTVQYGQSKNNDYGGGGSIADAGAIIGSAWLASRGGGGGTSSPPVVVRFVASLVGMTLAAVACYLGYIAIMDMLFENLSGFVFLAFSTCLLLWTTLLTFMAGYGSAANSFRGFCLLMVGIILDTVLKAGGAAIWCFDLKRYISSFLLKVLLGAALIISGHFARVWFKNIV